jgi:hypothetical protein
MGLGHMPWAWALGMGHGHVPYAWAWALGMGLGHMPWAWPLGMIRSSDFVIWNVFSFEIKIAGHKYI